MQITRAPIKSLHLDPANARAHPEHNMEAIAASLQRFGQCEPLVVQAGSRRVIGGNGRLAAMRTLGWEECDIVELDISDLDATSLGIALNRTAELAEWDDEVLGRLLKELQDEGALDGVGFDETEINELLEQLEVEEETELEDPGPGDPPLDPTSRPGDLWLLGKHRLLCGDSTRPQDVARLMDGERAVLLATDPPYCVRYDGSQRPQDSGKDWSGVYKEVEIEDLGKFLRAVLEAVSPHLTDSCAYYIWHAHRQYPVIDKVLEEFEILRHQPVIWKKPSSTFTYSYYRWAHEPCIFGWKKGHKPPHLLENCVDSVWEVDWEGKARIVGNQHPTQKPLRLFEIPMQQHTRKGDLILEPFSGSGSQLIAAEKLKRRCYAVEVEPAFVDVAVTRWQAATGKEAVLDGTDLTFGQVKAERVPCSTG